MTANDIIEKVRGVLNDGTGSDKYLDSVILTHIREALHYLWSVKPVTRYVNGVLDGGVVPAAATDVVPVDDRYALGLAYYAAARCYEDNITDTVNATLAQTLMAKADKEFI